MQGLESGLVKGLYKVVSQHRVTTILDVDSLENLDRNSMGWLPMREFLEFEQVWALRDYRGYIEDVQAKFPPPGSSAQAPAPAAAKLTLRQVAGAWFSNMEEGKFQDALAPVDENVVWENIPPTPDVSDLARWLGSYNGLPSVLKSFNVWASHSRRPSFKLLPLMVDGQEAMGIVHPHAQCLANGNEYDLYVATNLRIEVGKIKRWKVYWDISPLITAYRNI